MWIFIANSFLAAFLLFQIQPLVGKLILPSYGGASSVWSACLLFFQLCLLTGYAYANALVQKFDVKRQVTIHVTLVSVAMIWLVARQWHPFAPSQHPVISILGLLSLNIGIPVVLLAATSPLLQYWYRHTNSEGSPYRLYAYSNLGSLLALLTYPFLLERFCPLTWQKLLWGGSFIVYTLFCLNIFVKVRGAPDGRPDLSSAPTDSSAKKPSLTRFVWWVSLAICGVTLLLSATNEICRNIAPIALLWVVPLVIYLLTFIVTFKWERLYHRTAFGFALIVVVLTNSSLLLLPRNEYFAHAQVVLICLALLVGCMICHGELVKAKPDSRHLASFYFALSLGGAIGGVLVTLVAPLFFNQYVEWGLSLSFCCLLFLIAFRVDAWQSLDESSKRRDQKWTLVRLASLAGAGISIWIVLNSIVGDTSIRNFYGVLTVRTQQKPIAIKELIHATTVHGSQLINQDQRRVATTYYGSESGVGLAIDHCLKTADGDGIHLGVVGMGVGTVASYLDRGDRVRFYEINPAVVDIAKSDFSFVKDAQNRGAIVETVVGDGRLLLQSELATGPEQQFDLLVIDAFSGDSVPVHLVTHECFSLYWKHLKKSGILAIHISNLILDFEPVIRGQQLSDSASAAVVHHAGSPPLIYPSDWVLLARDPAIFSQPAFAQYAEGWTDPNRFVLWTDDHSSVTHILK